MGPQRRGLKGCTLQPTCSIPKYAPRSSASRVIRGRRALGRSGDVEPPADHRVDGRPGRSRRRAVAAAGDAVVVITSADQEDTMPRLETGDKAPGVHAARRHRREGLAEGLRRQARSSCTSTPPTTRPAAPRRRASSTTTCAPSTARTWRCSASRRTARRSTAGSRTKYKLKFPLLSDPTHAVMEKYGAWGEKTLYGKKSVGVIRSTFLIDARGKVARAWYSVQGRRPRGQGARGGHGARLSARQRLRVRLACAPALVVAAPAVHEGDDERDDHDRGDDVARGPEPAQHVVPAVAGLVADHRDERDPRRRAERREHDERAPAGPARRRRRTRRRRAGAG